MTVHAASLSPAAVRSDDITVILLVAGVGRRLGEAVAGPKVLLEFGGQTLLERHLRALIRHGISDIVLTVGYHSETIRREVARLGLAARITFIENPDFRSGSLVSLAVQAERLNCGRTILLMDGDVLYPPVMIDRLLAAQAENVLLLDRAIEPGDEPVKICFQGDRIVDLRKRPAVAFDWCGESVGFFRFSPDAARDLAARCIAYVAEGRTDLEYEEAIRDLIRAHPERFAATDISGIPWTEIDFVDDVIRAREQILPQLEEIDE